jgi:hypothetical protein
MEQDALLPVNLSSKGGLCQDKKSERVMFSNQGQDDEIQVILLIHQILNHPIGKGQHKEVS